MSLEDVIVTVTLPAPIKVTAGSAQGMTGAAGPTGQTGPAGPQGEPGPPGPPGGGTFSYVQAMPATVWNIAHNLQRFPSVTVVDSSGREVEGDVQYIDDNNVQVTFSAGFSGDAYLN